jgi:hypothetical protein
VIKAACALGKGEDADRSRGGARGYGDGGWKGRERLLPGCACCYTAVK